MCAVEFLSCQARPTTKDTDFTLSQNKVRKYTQQRLVEFASMVEKKINELLDDHEQFERFSKPLMAFITFEY